MKSDRTTSLQIGRRDQPASAYDNDQDYARPYHWYLSPDDILHGGMDYWQYIQLAYQLVQPLQKQTIIEVGCGDGRISDYFAAKFPNSRVVGIDISKKAIEFAQLLGQYAQYRHVNVFSVEEVFDIVLLIEVLEHIPKDDIYRFLEKIRDLLKCNGSLVLSVPTPRAPMWHPGHVQHFTAGDLGEVLAEARLQLTEIVYHLDFRLSRYSRGWSSLLRLFENRIWTIHPAMQVLKVIHYRYAMRASAKYGCRIVARAVRVSSHRETESDANN